MPASSVTKPAREKGRSSPVRLSACVRKTLPATGDMPTFAVFSMNRLNSASHSRGEVPYTSNSVCQDCLECTILITSMWSSSILYMIR